METRDIVVIGAGMVGAALAYGLARRGAKVLLMDGADDDVRAARANFGLVWFQSKGLDYPAYQGWTRRAIEGWPAFAEQLAEIGGTELDYEHRGGLTFCLGDEELTTRSAAYRAGYGHGAVRGDEFEVVERARLESMLPGLRLGQEVVGALYCPLDGHANPLRLLRALHLGFLRLGGELRSASPVISLAAEGGGFLLRTPGGSLHADRVVLAAGLGTGILAKQLGVSIPMRPQRGQILVTERIAPLLPFPASGLRQTREGTIMIGSTQEEVGVDLGTTVAGGARMASRTLRILPALEDVGIVRQWGGLRVLTPDAYPIYLRPVEHPGAYLALCHSGVTLASLHAGIVAGHILGDPADPALSAFHPERFDVP